MTVINMDDHRDGAPYIEGQCRCLNCEHEWLAVGSAGDGLLECPECSYRKGKFIGECVRGDALHEQCGCGNFYFLHAQDHGYYCPNCGLDAVGLEE